MYKEDLALNNLQCLMCHKSQPNPTQIYFNQTDTIALGQSGAGSSDNEGVHHISQIS